MAEYVAFPLSVESQQLIGVLRAGNTANSSASHTQIQTDSESVVGFARLVSQVTTAILMRQRSGPVSSGSSRKPMPANASSKSCTWPDASNRLLYPRWCRN